MTAKMLLKRVSLTFGAISVVAVLYRQLLRRPILNWGATDAEADARLPGDELLEQADGVSTRAITIEAPAVGGLALDRADGAVAARRRLHLRLDREPAPARHAQHRPRPARLPAPAGRRHASATGTNRMRLERVEPEHVLAWRSEDGNWVWSFVLDEQHGQTRLISRNRFRLPSLAARIGMVPMEPASLVMERKMLYGIKQRAERLAADRP